MRKWILRLAFVTCVLVAMVAGAVIETSHSHPEDVFPCPNQPPCTAPCDPSRYTIGYC